MTEEQASALKRAAENVIKAYGAMSLTKYEIDVLRAVLAHIEKEQP